MALTVTELQTQLTVPGNGSAQFIAPIPEAVMLIGKITVKPVQFGGAFGAAALQWADATGPDAPDRFAWEETSDSSDDIIEPHEATTGLERDLGAVGVYRDKDANPPTVMPEFRLRVDNQDPNQRDFDIVAELVG